MDLDSHDLASLAALIDGEGSIFIRKDTSQPRSINPRYYAGVVVTNSNVDVLNEFKEKTQLGVVYKRKSLKGSTNIPIYQWQIFNRQAKILLESILPYMQIKKKHAVIAIDLQILIAPRWGRNYRLSEEDLLVREAMKQAITILNHPSKERQEEIDIQNSKEGGIN